MKVGLKHIGLSVVDLATTEARNKKMDFIPVSIVDYEPCRRFYFRGDDGTDIGIFFASVD